MATVHVPPLLPQEECHAYIFHADADQQYARSLKNRLKGDGFVCHTPDETPRVTFGEPMPKIIADAVNKSKRIFSIVSTDMMKEDWFDFEVANSKAKANEKGEVIFIPIIHEVPTSHIPTYVKEIFCLESSAPDFYEQLKRLIIESKPLRDTIPAGNIAHGLAWSYFYGYLSFVLPEVDVRLSNSKFASLGPRLLPKMVIVLPETCKCPDNVTEIDSCITRGKEDFVQFNASRAGKDNRSYKTTIYKVTDPDNREEFYVAMEYATPLLALYEMEQGRMSNFDNAAKLRQTELFQQKMEDILEHPSNRHCHNRAVLLRYRDYGTEDRPQERLAKVLADCVRRELQESL